MGEDDFIRGVLADPKDDALLLVYSDWLEDQGDKRSTAKAEFLRTTVRPLAKVKGRKGAQKAKKARRALLQQLAASLDKSWLAVVSRLQLENCPNKWRFGQVRPPGPVRFEYVCDKKWQDLRPTDDRTVRFCDGCQQSVHYCETVADARKHAGQGHCVAVDLGVIRRDGDVSSSRRGFGGSIRMGRVQAPLKEQEEDE